MLGDTERVLEALNGAEVRYLVVGGVAVVLHGFRRYTADLDLVVQLDPENTRKAVRAIEGLGYRPRAPVPAEGFAHPATRASWIEEKGLTVFSFCGPGPSSPPVDLFVKEPFDFDAAYARAPRMPLERTSVPVASRSDLIAMKRASGRVQDLGDIAALEALAEPGGGPEPWEGCVREIPLQGWDAGFEEHRKEQIRRGLRITPAERLQWLEGSVEWVDRVAGRARPPSSGSGNGSGRTGGLA